MRIAIHTPPPGTSPADDRDAVAGEMMDVALDELMAAATAEGWHPAEIIAATLDWVVNTSLDHGRKATLEMLDQARRLAEARK